MGRVPKVDWRAVQEEFVAGGDEVTHVALGEKYHVERQTVTRHASKEDWNAQRAQYRHQVTKQTRERTSAHEAKLRADQIKSAAALRGLATQALDRLRRPGSRTVRDKDGNETVQATAPPLEAMLDAAECRRYLRTAAQIENQALGVEGELRIKLDAELTEILRRLQAILSTDDYGRVLDVLALPGDGEPPQN
jgi:hypothetical protein